MADSSNPLRSYGIRLAVIALAALLALRVGLPSGSSPAQSGPAEPHDSSPEAPNEDDADAGDVAYLSPLRNFLPNSVPTDATCADLINALKGVIKTTKNSEGEESEATLAPAGERKYDAKFLIATVPDPQLAGTDYLTDALLESIRKSIETPRLLVKSEEQLKKSDEPLLTRGPVLDRYWLPWGEKLTPTFAEFGRGRPGMLVFRQPRERGFIGVLVVGEHPGLGLDRLAMQKALKLVNCLQDDNDATIRILGPTFTGTQDSLARELSKFETERSKDGEKPRDYSIFNGSATSLRVDFLIADAHPAAVAYQSTIIPDRDVENYLLHFLAGEPETGDLAALKSVAFLVESDTGYGQQVGIGLERFNDSMQVMVIPFPINVSRVLAAYQAQRLKASEKLPRLQSSDLQVGVPLQTKDMQFRRMQPYEPGLAAVRIDLLLREITRSIREQKVRYVGVIATNSLDKLFLASLVRQACPDVRLFATTGELTMTHADVSGDLTGMVVASTYPMFRSNQAWTGPNFAGLQAAFGHQSELGVYNAMQLLLGQPGRMMEYRRPFAPAGEGDLDRPPVWISVVGRDAIYPLRTFPLRDLAFHYKDDEKYRPEIAEKIKLLRKVYRPSTSDDPPSETPSQGPSIGRDPGAPLPALVLITAACAATLGVTNWTTRRRPKAIRRVSALAALATACLAAFWFAAAWLLRGADWELSYLGAAKFASWLALSASAAALGRVAANGFIAQRFARPWARRTTDIAEAAGVASAAIAYAWAATWRPDAAMFDLTRTINLKGGVSPLAPLALWTMAAVMLSLAHAGLAVAFSPSNRLAPLDLPRHDDLADVRDQVADLELAIAEPWKPRDEDRKVVRWVPVAAVGLLLGLPATWDLLTRSSLDMPWHGGLCAALYATTLVLLCWHAWWLAGLATRIRHMLLRFGALPCAKAFGELPGGFGEEVSGGLFRWISTSLDRMLAILEDQNAAIHHKRGGDNRKLPLRDRWNQLHRDLCLDVARLADDVWPQRFVAPASDQAEDAKAQNAENAESQPSSAQSPAGKVEVFVAGMLFTYLMPILIQLRRLSKALMGAAIAFVLATWSYPFIPQTSLQLSAWAIVLLVAHRLWRIASQLNSDEVMSRATGTPPNQVTWNPEYTGVILTYIGPVVALLLYSFFGLPEGVVQWLGGLTGR